MLDEVNVLAVDDVAENLVALVTLLKVPGIRVITARSGIEALEILLVKDLALALLDVNMPGMDGFELAELMRGSERTRHVPIIFLTAAVPERTRIFQGYDAGAVDFLFKPLDPHLLASKVEVFAQLHRQKRQLASQLDQLQQAQKMSDLFIGVLGHDLRNPLNSIVVSATLLEMKPDNADGTRRAARVIHQASGRMQRLIQQVLDFALARVKGGIPVEPVDADLGKLARQFIAELEDTSAVRMRTEIVGDCTGKWDVDRMMQVLSNLVGNALEHGDPKAPIVVRLDGSEDKSVRLEFHNGGAIPRATLDVLFSPFKPRHQHTRGIGLGLYIVEQIVRAHGGELKVHSDERDGTTFQIQLPRQPKTPPV